MTVGRNQIDEGIPTPLDMDEKWLGTRGLDIPSSDTSRKLAVYAIGGNALSSPSSRDDDSSKLVRKKVLEDTIDLLEAGYKVVLTHGNGPQVGDLLLLEEESSRSPLLEGRQRLTLETWVAATQGWIGHELLLELDSNLRTRGRSEQATTILTRIEVDADDDGFRNPTKPVGPVIDANVVTPADWVMTKTDKGMRRVVASPKPLRVMDIPVLQALLEEGVVVICGGGGGIPVVRSGDAWNGVPAVVDKDLLSAMIAVQLGASLLIISTAVDAIHVNHGEPTEESLSELPLSQAKELVANGTLPAGSMGPKVSAMIQAKEQVTEMMAIVCQPGDAMDSVRGEAGTILTND